MKKLFYLIVLLSAGQITFAQGTRLLRQPTLSTEKIVFVYADDLWMADRNGGTAQRLTSNEGTESEPHFSPDEQYIAFTAEYDGNTDVYVMPAGGGNPQRLTFHPGADVVQGWTPDNKVLFRSGREGYPTHLNKLYTVDLEGNLPAAIGVPRAAWGEVSPDGKHIAYVPITFWDPEWRNYRGGQAMPIWIVDLETKELIRTPQPTRERHLDPVWYGDEVFFLSERDYASNIWAFNPSTQALRQVTFHKDYDVKSLDAGPGGIVYEQGSYLHLLDPANGESKQVAIEVRGDMNFARPRWEDVAANALRNPQISPSGKRALFEYRGEIFSVPKEEGDWRNLTNSSGIADRAPVWSPKGDRIAWFSDESGEYRLVIADQLGSVQKTLPLPNPTFYFQPDWSPDGKFIAYTDTDYNIWYVNVETGATQKVDTDRYAHPNRDMNPVWSPDSKWIAYARQLESHFKAIFAYNVESGERHQLTDGMADAITPVWDEAGKYLYFLASTNYGLKSGWLDMSSYDPDLSRNLYLIVLDDSTSSPFMWKTGDESTGEKKKEEKKDEEVQVNITPAGISNRILAVDIPSRNYTGLLAGPAGSVFILESVPNESGAVLHKYDLEKQENSEFMTGVREGVTSTDRKSMLVRTNGWSIVDTKSKPKSGDGRLSMNLRIKIEPGAEYQQIFKEGWRYMRDFLYVENVHGAPWDKVWDWYSPWIADVRHRSDLNYVLDILSGEVSVGHSYVRGGDMPDVERVGVGLLGADYAIENDRYRIKKIYTGESWNPNLSGPLAIPGLGINTGDYILGVNGRELDGSQNIYSFFEETDNRQTVLTVNNTPNMNGARQVTVKPISSESQLRSFDWIEGNRRKVDELSDGKLAYVYVPNTSGNGFAYFNRYYFAQQDRKGVVIDERNNGGGSAADYMIDIMNRQLFGFFNSAANDRRPWTTPMAGIWGPKVMIINERAGSGGDLLPYMFKEAKIGPLVGTRTWGGLVGTWDTPPFIDGGRFVAPRGGFYDVNGEWAVEGEGISPDIEVIQEPKRVLEGHDPQLEAAVEEAMRLLRENEFELKPEPEAPVRYRRPEGN
ncbi:S41 family peptidase [Flavilitoribacter nigricans]|uniref:Tricorn protease homolog n=1 Tax=Flavilitoribacter nigricans (strain ATCC 23147 / DSM 23189 / NBRC 102662 / NCIMB 1420 / SS-2) TaxID=1122177 RepID=A0A2D0MWI3_FLAN2|nr:S41 family peptidase [Flavilitoribacter nigricans]PHN00642.1 protease [Flavilitoribacter nigricans DSM 23189 = NBRC 102662]